MRMDADENSYSAGKAKEIQKSYLDGTYQVYWKELYKEEAILGADTGDIH